MAQIQNTGLSLFFFVLLVTLFLFSLSESHFMQKTISGQRFESLQTLNSKYMPQVFANFTKQNYVKYKLHKIPNYIEELFKYNKEFLPIYKSGNKHTVIIFSRKQNSKNPNLDIFYNKLNDLIKQYPESFNYINLDYDEDTTYAFKANNFAYKDLKNICEIFCLIDPVRNTIFSFSDSKNSEIEALSIIFQEYSLLSK